MDCNFRSIRFILLTVSTNTRITPFWGNVRACAYKAYQAAFLFAAWNRGYITHSVRFPCLAHFAGIKILLKL